MFDGSAPDNSAESGHQQSRFWRFIERFQTRDVEVPRDHTVAWPTPNCACCAANLADRALTLRVPPRGFVAGMLHLLLLPLNPIWSTATTWVGSARFDVPMCPQCHRASFRRRWLGRVLPLLILIVLLLAGLWLGRWVVSLHPQPWFANVVTAAVLAIAIGSAIGINQLIRLPVDVVPAKDKLVFSFESHEAATAFAQMNEVQVENRPEELFQEIMQELFGTRSDSDCQA